LRMSRTAKSPLGMCLRDCRDRSGRRG
jgi:hypothetical protein